MEAVYRIPEVWLCQLPGGTESQRHGATEASIYYTLQGWGIGRQGRTEDVIQNREHLLNLELGATNLKPHSIITMLEKSTLITFDG